MEGLHRVSGLAKLSGETSKRLQVESYAGAKWDAVTGQDGVIIERSFLTKLSYLYLLSVSVL